MRLGRIQFSQAGVAAVLAFVVSPAVVAVFIGWFESVRPFEGMFVVSAPLLFASLAALAALARGTATSFKIPLLSKQLEFSQKEDRGPTPNANDAGHNAKNEAPAGQGAPPDTNAESEDRAAVQQGAMLRTVGIVVFFLAYFVTWSWNYNHKTPSVGNLFPGHKLSPEETLEIHSLRLNLLFDMDGSSIAADFGLSRASFNAPIVDTVVKDVIGSILESTEPGPERINQIKMAAATMLGPPDENADAFQADAIPPEPDEPENLDPPVVDSSA